MNNPILNKLFVFIIFLGTIFFAVKFGLFLLGIFMPFLVGLLIAFLSNPINKLLNKKLKIHKSISSFLGIIFVFSAISITIYFIVIIIKSQLPNITNTFKGMYENAMIGIENIYNGLHNRFPYIVKDNYNVFYNNTVNNLSNILLGSSSNISSKIFSFAKGLPSALIFSIVALISSYFISIEYDSIIKYLKNKINSNSWAKKALLSVKGGAKKGVGSWIKAQFVIMTIVSIISAIVFTLLNIKFAIAIAIFLAIFDALPIFGSGAILWPMAIYNIIYKDYRAGIFIIILYILIVGIRQFIEPKFIGKQIGINPLITLFTIYTGFKVMGLIGMILGIILLVSITSIYRNRIEVNNESKANI